jgi:hypothetical protein
MALPTLNHRPYAVHSDDSGFREFAGIINTRTSKEIARSGLIAATNVEIDDEKRLLRRNGYSLAVAGAVRGAYATNDQSKLYLVIGTDLIRLMDDGTQRVLHSGLTPVLPVSGYSWAEDPSNYVTYTNGVDSGIVRNGLDWLPLAINEPVITAATVVDVSAQQTMAFHIGSRYITNTLRIFATYLLPDGRESAPSAVWQITSAPEVATLSVVVAPQYAATRLYASPPGGDVYFFVAQSTAASFTVPVADLYSAAGVEYPFTTAISGFPSACRHLTFYDGRMYASEYIPERGMSVVWISEPLQYHLFNKAEDFFTIIGEVVLLLPSEKGLVVGTDNQIYGWDGEKLTEVVQYGVVVGHCGDVAPDGTAYFWTLRGVAKAFPYELVTEQTFSGDPGVFNHAKLLFEHGFVKLVASTVVGNDVFNKRSE